MEDKEVFSAQANLCRAMANSTRIEIVHLLRDQPLRVSDIARRIDCPQPRVSRNLALLRNTGLVRGRRHGSDMVYEIANPKVADVCNLMRELLAEEAALRSALTRGLGDDRSG